MHVEADSIASSLVGFRLPSLAAGVTTAHIAMWAPAASGLQVRLLSAIYGCLCTGIVPPVDVSPLHCL